MENQNIKQNTQNETVKNKKKPSKLNGIFGLPHILMGAGILVGYGFVPMVFSAIQRIICGTDGVALNFLAGDIFFLISSLIALVIYIAVSCFAYRNLGGALRFLGVVFVTTGIVGIIEKFVGIIVSAIGAIFIKSYVGYDGVLDAISTKSVIPGIIVDSLFIFGYGVVAAAIGIALLMLISKLSVPMKKKKAKKEEKKANAEAVNTK